MADQTEYKLTAQKRLDLAKKINELIDEDAGCDWNDGLQALTLAMVAKVGVREARCLLDGAS